MFSKYEVSSLKLKRNLIYYDLKSFEDKTLFTYKVINPHTLSYYTYILFFGMFMNSVCAATVNILFFIPTHFSIIPHAQA